MVVSASYYQYDSPERSYCQTLGGGDWEGKGESGAEVDGSEEEDGKCGGLQRSRKGGFGSGREKCEAMEEHNSRTGC